jgi:hypothetical protein
VTSRPARVDVWRTAWRVVGVPDFPNRLDVMLVVDTTAPAVIDALEAAAAGAGVRLERVELGPEPAED